MFSRTSRGAALSASRGVLADADGLQHRVWISCGLGTWLPSLSFVSGFSHFLRGSFMLL